jgi:hypothetical protein
VAVDQALIDEFTPQGPAIHIDDRETSSKVVEILSGMGAAIRSNALPVGDYAIGRPDHRPSVRTAKISFEYP